MTITRRDVTKALSDATGLSEEKIIVMAVTTTLVATVRLAFRVADFLMEISMEA